MAKFNETPQFGNDPNYLGYSKEVDRAQNYQTPNRALGTLFEGIGDMVEAGAHIADTHNKNMIEKDLFAGVDSIRKEAGVDLATDVASKGQSLFDGNGQPQLPPGATANKDEIEKLTAAFQSGQLNSSYYWGRVNSLVKQVRAQYPGYRNEIDQTISGIVGANPANALRSALVSEYEQAVAGSKSKANREETFINQNLEYLPQDYWERQQKGNPYGYEEVRQIVAQKQRKKAEISDEKAQLELKATQNKLTSEEAEGSATFNTQNVVNQLLSEASRSLGEQTFAKIKEGKPLDGEELQKFQAESAKLMYQAETVVNNVLNSPFQEGGKNSYASVIKDGSKLKAIKDNALAQIKTTLDLIQNGQYGLANQNANLAKAMQDSDMARLLQSSDAARKIATAQKLHGSALNVFLGEPEGRAIMNEATTALRNLHLAENITGQGNGLTAQLNQYRNEKTKKVDPVAANTIIRDVEGVLQSKNFNVEAKKNMALQAFGDKSIDFINQFADKKTVYLRMLSPENTKAMIELKSTAPEAFQAYSKWATTNFSTIFKSEADTVQKFITGGEGAQVRFDPATGTFGLFVDPNFKSARQGIFAGPGGMAANSAGVLGNIDPNKAFDLDYPGVRKALSSVNQMLGTLKPIYEADGKQSTEAFVKIITDINPSSPKEQGLMQMLWEGFKNAIVPGAKASTLDEGKAPEIKLTDMVDNDRDANPLGEEAGALPFNKKTAATDDRRSSIDADIIPAASYGGDLAKEPGAHSENVASLPAGMRNNNPGNIKYVGQAGTRPSSNTDEGDPQAVYKTPLDGMVAMAQLLKRKFDGGKKNAAGIIAAQNGWTPGNFQAAANVAKTMGVMPAQDLNFNDPKQLKSFMRALILQEHGPAGKRYSDDLIEAAVAQVLGTKVANN